jgi:protein FRA10AC1
LSRFIRDDEEVGDVSWEERLARAYESKLFKEFALVSQGAEKAGRM